MTRNDIPDNTQQVQPAPPSSGLLPVFAVAAITALLVFVCVFYIDDSVREQSSRKVALRSMQAARSALAAAWGRGSSLAKVTARQCAGAKADAAFTILRQTKTVWPAVSFSIYDKTGELLKPGPSVQEILDAPPVAHTVRAIVQRALTGNEEAGISQVRGFVGLSSAMPVSGSDVGALVVSLPLDNEMLQNIKQNSLIDLAVLPFTGVNMDTLDMAAASGTYAGMQGNALSRESVALGGANESDVNWAQLSGWLGGKSITAEEVLPLPGGNTFLATAPLVGPDGAVYGALVASGSENPLGLPPFWLWGLPLLAAIVSGFGVAQALNRNSAEIASSYAGALAKVIEGLPSPDNIRRHWTDWPGSMRDSFEKITSVIKRYRERAHEAERRRMAACEMAGASQEDDLPDFTCTKENFLRLFSTAPVGVFHAEASGRFIRVNQTFAELLEYDSPSPLIADKPTLGDFFLYGEDIISPLPTLAGGSAAGKIVSLRGRDGLVRNYTLNVHALTSPSGEVSGLYEGFLRGRTLEDAMKKIEQEKDVALQQQSSTALLLAATCLQIKRYLAHSFSPRTASGAASVKDAAAKDAAARSASSAEKLSVEPAAASAATPAATAAATSAATPGSAQAAECQPASGERRSGVRSSLSVLDDIYQIARTEAGHNPLLSLSVDLTKFFASLAEQARPALLVRGVALQCEISRELPRRFSVPEAQLRHALERALLCVVAPVQRGVATVSLRRDHNAPSMPGLERIICSVTWSEESAFAAQAVQDGTVGTDRSYQTLLDWQADPEAMSASPDDSAVVLDVSGEEAVLSFLARRMDGEYLDTVFRKGQRSIEFVVPFALAAAEEGDGQAEGQQEASGPASRQDLAHAEAAHMAPALDDTGSFYASSASDAYYPTVEISPVDISDISPLVADSVPGYEAGDELDVSEGQGVAAEAEGASRRGLDILLIDNNVNSRMMFSMFLSNMSNRITEAHDGQAGVEAFHKGRYDLVFLDMDMPLMDGYQVTRIIRALEAENHLSATPIVGMTSYALPEFRQRCIQAGCTEFLTRPFTKHALYRVIDSLRGQFVEEELSLEAEA